MTRELTVYLPPGYDEARNRRYPVLYLLHGFANDHHSWHRYGRANDILDNLLAQESSQPFLVVMPLGYGGAQINGDGFSGIVDDLRWQRGSRRATGHNRGTVDEDQGVCWDEFGL